MNLGLLNVASWNWWYLILPLSLVVIFLIGCIPNPVCNHIKRTIFFKGHKCLSFKDGTIRSVVICLKRIFAWACALGVTVIIMLESGEQILFACDKYATMESELVYTWFIAMIIIPVLIWTTLGIVYSVILNYLSNLATKSSGK